MFQEMKNIEEKFRELTQSLSDPALASDPQKIRKISKQRAELEPVVIKFEAYKRILKGIKESEGTRGEKRGPPRGPSDFAFAQGSPR